MTIDLSDPEFWTLPWSDRDAAFDALRAEPAAPFFEEMEIPGMPRGRGYYSLTRHADVVEASRLPDRFASGRGGTNIGDIPPEMQEFLGSIINMDDPRHARQRRIVARAFTPKVLEEAMGSVEQVAAEIVDEVIEAGEADVVEAIAARLPLRIVLDMMGVPRSQEQFVLDHTNVIIGPGDPEYVPAAHPLLAAMALMKAGQEMVQMASELAEFRRANPGNDLMSLLVHAQDEEEGSLTAQELGSFFVLLAVAGNETTRTAISHGLYWLTQHPDQRDWWWESFDERAPQAVEEIVRYATPVVHFRRTVTTDGTVIAGRELSEGDKVVLWYNAANRDPAVFSDPHRFDLSRPLAETRQHVGFGGPGPHYCLGAHLARREITAMFSELHRRIPGITTVGEPDRLKSNFVNGIKHLRAEW